MSLRLRADNAELTKVVKLDLAFYNLAMSDIDKAISECRRGVPGYLIRAKERMQSKIDRANERLNRLVEIAANEV